MTGIERINSTQHICALCQHGAFGFAETAEAGIDCVQKMMVGKTKGSAFAFPLGFLIEEPVISSWLSSLPFS
jgi:hypothetical protein